MILLVLAVYELFKRTCKSNKPFHHLSRYLVCVSIAIQTLAIVAIVYFLLQVTHDCGEFTRVTSGLVLFLVFNMGWLYAYEALSVVTHMHRVSTQHLLTPENEVRMRAIFVGTICVVCIVVCLGFFISSLYTNHEKSITFEQNFKLVGWFQLIMGLFQFVTGIAYCRILWVLKKANLRVVHVDGKFHYFIHALAFLFLVGSLEQVLIMPYQWNFRLTVAVYLCYICIEAVFLGIAWNHVKIDKIVSDFYENKLYAIGRDAQDKELFRYEIIEGKNGWYRKGSAHQLQVTQRLNMIS